MKRLTLVDGSGRTHVERLLEERDEVARVDDAKNSLTRNICQTANTA